MTISRNSNNYSELENCSLSYGHKSKKREDWQRLLKSTLKEAKDRDKQNKTKSKGRGKLFERLKTKESEKKIHGHFVYKTWRIGEGRKKMLSINRTLGKEKEERSGQ